MDRSRKTIGPMIAHTSTVGARIWLRAGESILADKRKFVARLLKPDTDEILEEHEFTFLCNFDHVGLSEFGNGPHLKPDTSYSYQVGFLDHTSRFEKIGAGIFRTFSSDTHKEISFVTGSCRHLYVGKRRDLGDDESMFVADEGVHYGDRAFKTITDIPEITPDFMIMSGDQVYCDHNEGSFAPIKPAKTLLDYYDNYYRAYLQPYFASLAASLPIYMAMDDHEIKNDWHMDMIHKGHNSQHENNLVHYKNGLTAYSVYQAALSSVIKNVGAFSDELTAICSTDYEEQMPSDKRPYKDKSKKSVL